MVKEETVTELVAEEPNPGIDTATFINYENINVVVEEPSLQY